MVKILTETERNVNDDNRWACQTCQAVHHYLPSDKTCKRCGSKEPFLKYQEYKDNSKPKQQGSKR